ncbi:MAG: hypothetical protein M0Q88_08480 [Bacilli bacterium]|nr:hypothetical protein [Bacilli bacterium]
MNINTDDILNKVSMKPTIKQFDFDKHVIKKDDYAKLRDIVSSVEDYFEIDDIRGMRVEDLLIYVREMVRG